MIFSREVKGTSSNKPKMSWWDYWINHCWMTGWQSIKYSFQNWADLMTGNWKDYALMFYDDPYEECNDCFWSYLGEDDTLPKEFLEHLQQMVEDIETGKEKLIPMDEDFMNRLKDLTDGVDVDLFEDLKSEAHY
jgi:hypothetical protein